MRIGDAARETLRWQQPLAARRRYVLEVKGQAVAKLAFRSAFGTLAEGTSEEGTWTFKRVGFFAGRVTVRRGGGDTDLAVYVPGTWDAGGTLTLAGGRSIKITTNLWHTRMEFLGDDGATLLHLDVGGLGRLSVEVQSTPAALPLPELPWLVMLGCYLVVNMRSDAEALAATVPVLS